jgi:sulfur-oxidizing protein SoxA
MGRTTVLGAGLLLVSTLLTGLPLASAIADAKPGIDPQADRQALRDYYSQRFPDVPLEEHINGVYALDEGAREQWLEMEDFPPYEIAVDEGAELYEAPFADGQGYPDCFGDGAVKGRYPHYDDVRSEVVTLEMAINECRADHGEAPLAYDGGEITRLTAYMAYASRGQIIDVALPEGEGALAAYESGRRFYSTRRGQLNFACSSCHVQLAGNRLRAERLSASLGQVTHWPVYRFKWQDVGSLHLRFNECNSQVGAEPFPPQSVEYRNLEYFLSYMSNGLELNGPASRK